MVRSKHFRFRGVSIGSVRFGAIVTSFQTSLRASRSARQILTAPGPNVSTELLIPASLARALTEPAIISHRNTAVAANAPIRALRQDQRNSTEYEPRPAPDPRSAGQKISLTKFPPTPVPSRFRRHLNQAKLQIPIDHRRSPADSCMGGFRTPDGIRKPSPSLPPSRSVELSESGHSSASQ